MHDRTRSALRGLGEWALDVLALALALIIATPVAAIILSLIAWWVLG